MGTLSVRSLSHGSLTYVRLYGVIDDAFVAEDVFGEIRSGHVILNLKAVTRISSFGVREWVNAIKALVSRTENVTLVDCSPCVVSQLNMVANFAAGAAIMSIQVPYYCENCDWDCCVSTPIRPDLAETPELAAVHCQRCKSVMVLNDDASTLFAFARDSRIGSLSPDAEEFMRSFEKALSESQDPGGPTPKDGARSEPTEMVPQGLRVPPARIMMGLAAVLVAVVVAVWLVSSPFGTDATPSEVTGTDSLLAQGAQPAAFAEGLAEIDKLLSDHRPLEAASILEQLKTAGSMPPETANSYDLKLRAARQAQALVFRREAQEHWQAKRTEAALQAARHSEELWPLDSETTYLMAESLRLGGDLTSAIRYYEMLCNQFPTSPHVDAATYWQAEHLVLIGKRDQARVLLKRVVRDMKKSSFRTTARRRLRALGE